jgi:hypothetical protein
VAEVNGSGHGGGGVRGVPTLRFSLQVGFVLEARLLNEARESSSGVLD